MWFVFHYCTKYQCSRYGVTLPVTCRIEGVTVAVQLSMISGIFDHDPYQSSYCCDTSTAIIIPLPIHVNLHVQNIEIFSTNNTSRFQNSFLSFVFSVHYFSKMRHSSKSSTTSICSSAGRVTAQVLLLSFLALSTPISASDSIHPQQQPIFPIIPPPIPESNTRKDPAGDHVFVNLSIYRVVSIMLMVHKH